MTFYIRCLLISVRYRTSRYACFTSHFETPSTEIGVKLCFVLVFQAIIRMLKNFRQIKKERNKQTKQTTDHGFKSAVNIPSCQIVNNYQRFERA